MKTFFAAVTALIVFCAAEGFPSSAAPKKKTKKRDIKSTELNPEFDLKTASFKEIIDRYVFIADFNQKPAERPISQEFFWKYPFKLPPIQFELDLDRYDLASLIFQVKGSGQKIAMFNDGRAAFLEGDHQKAHTIWLAGREQFSEDVKSNKLLEYFLGVNALAAYKKMISDPKTPSDPTAEEGILKRIAYFFASTYILRRDISDARIDPMAAWALYNMGAIYYKFDRLPSVYGAAQEGLATLLKRGETLHRSDFRQLAAEALIRNQDMIGAIQELDTALRQDPDPRQASRIFNRAGDIYFSLSNYELAEDMYGMALAIDRERRIYNAGQAILRAETSFWLGKFDDAEKSLEFSVDAAMRLPGNDWLQESQTLPWAYLRMADTILARAAIAKEQNKKDLLQKARLSYFGVQSRYPKSEAARIAEVRGACMDMPSYQGNNVKHARLLLEDVKEKKDIPENLMELVWACYAGSFSERERTDEMVEKIQDFADKYPRSRFLNDMLPPVREVQAAKIDSYFAKKQWESATEFFEQRRSTLFPKVSDGLAEKLWTAYVATSRSSQALEFWRGGEKPMASDTEALRRAAFIYETLSLKGSNLKLANDRRNLEKELMKRRWAAEPSKEDVGYLSRVLASPEVTNAYPWILKLQDAWTEDDDDAPCSVLFPLISRILADKKSSPSLRKNVVDRVKQFTAENLEDLRESDATCFQSWLDLESKVLTTPDLEALYSKRASWPLAGPWLERTWTWSEELNSRGKKTEAAKLWQEIAAKAPPESFESRMAKTRLDPSRTEFESLWR